METEIVPMYSQGFEYQNAKHRSLETGAGPFIRNYDLIDATKKFVATHHERTLQNTTEEPLK
jgi:hypothetical protein